MSENTMNISLAWAGIVSGLFFRLDFVYHDVIQLQSRRLRLRVYTLDLKKLIVDFDRLFAGMDNFSISAKQTDRALLVTTTKSKQYYIFSVSETDKVIKTPLQTQYNPNADTEVLEDCVFNYYWKESDRENYYITGYDFKARRILFLIAYPIAKFDLIVSVAVHLTTKKIYGVMREYDRHGSMSIIEYDPETKQKRTIYTPSAPDSDAYYRHRIWMSTDILVFYGCENFLIINVVNKDVREMHCTKMNIGNMTSVRRLSDRYLYFTTGFDSTSFVIDIYTCRCHTFQPVSQGMPNYLTGVYCPISRMCIYLDNDYDGNREFQCKMVENEFMPPQLVFQEGTVQLFANGKIANTESLREISKNICNIKHISFHKPEKMTIGDTDFPITSKDSWSRVTQSLKRLLKNRSKNANGKRFIHKCLADKIKNAIKFDMIQTEQIFNRKADKLHLHRDILEIIKSKYDAL